MTFVPARNLTKAEKEYITYWAEKIGEVGEDRGAIAVCLEAFLLNHEQIQRQQAALAN